MCFADIIYVYHCATAISYGMDFNRLKELTKKLGGILVLDGNEPEFVILPYGRYEKIEAGEDVPISNKNPDERPDFNGAADDEKTVEKLNQEIMALKEEIRHRESAELLQNTEPAQEFSEAVDLD